MRKVISFLFLVSIGCRQRHEVMYNNNLSLEMNHYQNNPLIYIIVPFI